MKASATALPLVLDAQCSSSLPLPWNMKITGSGRRESKTVGAEMRIPAPFSQVQTVVGLTPLMPVRSATVANDLRAPLDPTGRSGEAGGCRVEDRNVVQCEAGSRPLVGDFLPAARGCFHCGCGCGCLLGSLRPPRGLRSSLLFRHG